MRASQAQPAMYALLATVLFPICSIAQHEPSINVALRTSFDAAPYLVELLETAALENSTSYFPLLDRVAEGVFAISNTEEELYKKFVEVLRRDGHIQSAESLSSFNYALALHAAAPRIEAHYQYYRTAVEPQMMAAQDAVCPVWVHLDGQQYCSPALERAQQSVEIGESDAELPFDRTLGDASDVPVSVVYADITQPLFAQFHETVSNTAKEGKSVYRIRYRPSGKQSPLFVSGYGTELVLKRTDYIVIDDRDAAEKDQEKDENSKRSDKASDLKPLTTSEVAKLGLNAASYILASEDPFATLIDVSANFPKFSGQIAGYNASENFLKEHYTNREMLLPPGFNVIWMNGLQVEQRHINAYSLMDILKKERRLIQQLRDIGLSSTQAVDILSHEVLTKALTAEDPQRFDWRDDEEGNSAIVWMNNIEHDKRYENWMSSLQMLLQRTYPGQLPQIRRNIYNLVVPIDLGKIEDLNLVVNTLQTIVKRLIPIRVGLVPAGNSEIAKTGTQLCYHIMDTYGVATLMHFFQKLVESKKGLSTLEAIFEETIKERQPRDGKTASSFAGATSSPSIEDHVQASQDYRVRLGLEEGDALSVIINGVILPRDDSWFDVVSQKVVSDQRMLQLEVYEQRLVDEMDVAETILSKAALRRNILIAPADPKNVTIFNVADISSQFEASFGRLPRLPGIDPTLLSEQGHLLVVADFDSQSGRQLLNAASEFYSKHPEVEVVLLHNTGIVQNSDAIATELFVSSDNDKSSISKATIDTILLPEFSSKDQSDGKEQAAADFWTAQKPLIRRLGIQDGGQSLWLNGRMVGPIVSDFALEDFEALYAYEKTSRIAPVTTGITGVNLEDKFKTPLDLAKLTSIVARSLVSDMPQDIYEAGTPVRIDRFKKFADKYTSIHVPSTGEPTIQIVAVVDPASELAQPWIPILKTLSELDGIDVKVFLNPKNKLEELPIKRFYRQVINSAPTFDVNGKLTTPRASFTDIPKDTLFNLGMVVPPPWLVAPKDSIYDLDNIKLSSVPAGQNVDAVYELEHILIEGHSRDSLKNSPPRGVQLLLGTEQNQHHTDTIIMANLGYFQFKANPGHWQISLKPGRSSKIFTIDSVGAKGYAPQPGDETTSVSLLSFQGLTLYPRLSRKPGMEKEEVLESTATGSAMDYLGKGASFASSALSSIGFKKGKTAQIADINIFSVASGHLYERMLNIMMVSVMRHTKHTVKFWFIEQFLSPSFKSSLPILAEHYKFDYEMVTYKWPHWLRGQKEKQREIWGYKILFLDVLFPLNLDKVIFVDADQIVRTDMMELNKVDLGGAPYGFTPMCDSRTEMEGFRFWKQGYWKNFLDGKPYHISALYVVDLKNFRQVAAGDRLRQQYHSLSADPASLSNLDQDLPNHMQHVLPIHSLPQEWLWCETWCSDESLANARTIDLCNNPQTKEPKLDRARRQVPEWTEYDDEIAGVLKTARGASGNQTFMQDGGGVQEHEQKVLSDNDNLKKDEL